MRQCVKRNLVDDLSTTDTPITLPTCVSMHVRAHSPAALAVDRAPTTRLLSLLPTSQQRVDRFKSRIDFRRPHINPFLIGANAISVKCPVRVNTMK
jgi:hypothetical protein